MNGHAEALQTLACDAVAHAVGTRMAAAGVRAVGGAASRRSVYAFGPEPSMAGGADGANGRCVYAKVYPDDGAALQQSRLQRLRAVLARGASTGPLSVPAPLGTDPGGRCLVVAAAAGELLADTPAGPALCEALGRVGAALAQLHALPSDLFEPVAPGSAGLDDQTAALMRPHPLLLAECLPAWAPRVRALLAGIADGLAGPHPLVLAHRDVHPRQLFVSPGGVELIDWDLAGAADPALDLANLLLHVERHWPGFEAPARAALLQGYGAARVAALAARLPAWTAFHHLRRACKAERLGQGRPAVGQQLAAAESALHASKGIAA